MSHFDFKKWPCHSSEYKGQEPQVYRSSSEQVVCQRELSEQLLICSYLLVSDSRFRSFSSNAGHGWVDRQVRIGCQGYDQDLLGIILGF